MIVPGIWIWSLVAFVLVGCWPGLAFSQNPTNSILSQGPWIKIGVVEYGVHRLDFEFLQNAGLDPEDFDPRNLRIYGNGGGMLPQANSDPRPQDLIENAIQMVGEDDGVFDPQDYLLFYGQGADRYEYDPAANDFFYQKNLYSDTTFYFVTVSNSPGLRIGQNQNQGTSFPLINDYDYYVSHEDDRVKVLSPGSGREWYGEKFDFILTQDFLFSISKITPGSAIQLIASVVGQSFGAAKFNVSMNNQPIGELPIQKVDAGTYSLKGTNSIDTFRITSDEISITGDELIVGLEYERLTTARSLGYLNFLFITASRQLALEEDQLTFRSRSSLKNDQSTFEISQFSSEALIWDISDPLLPAKQDAATAGDKARFGVSTQELKEFIAFIPSSGKVPFFKGNVPNQNLRGAGVVDMVVVTHPSLLLEAQRLATFRTSNDGLSVKVATTTEIYNEFASGAQDLTAIRDYMRHLYEKGGGAGGLKYLLLFGKGSYDYKEYLPGEKNLVPIYESRNSLHPIFSFSSDDYYGFLDQDEGLWEESRQGDHIMDIGIGRLPVVDAKEAKEVVTKILNYTNNPKSVGDWRNQVVFVADDGDVNIHQRDAEKLATLVDTAHSEFDIKKLYMDAFQQIPTPKGEIVPDLNEELNNAVENGVLMVNFIGHGGETGWAQEGILDLQTIKEYKNRDQLPLFVTATCEFGRHDDPNRRSGGELLVTNPKGGAIALITTARPVFSNTNFQLNTALMSTLFERVNGQYQTLGDIMKFTKNNSLSGSVNRNFSLLGDPSMKLTYPKESISITSINGTPISDSTTNLRALETVKLEGQITQANGQVMKDFSGVLIATIFDKASEMTTFGNESPSVTFLERKSKIFKGQVSVTAGEFEIDFVVPKNISYTLDQAKVSMYASDSLLDANGANLNILIGGSNPNIPIDTEPPEISLYMDDPSFQFGGWTGPNTTLFARIQDENGINITNIGFGQEIKAYLDDEHEFILNDFFVTDLDDFTSGWVEFPFTDLEPGRHTIRFKAWDSHNNSNEQILEFFVGEGAKIDIQSVINYPNPFSASTKFRISHNREGEDLALSVDIYNLKGELVISLKNSYSDSPPTLEAIEWDGRGYQSDQVKEGIYIYRVVLQSLEDGSKNETFKKLIIIN